MYKYYTSHIFWIKSVLWGLFGMLIAGRWDAFDQDASNTNHDPDHDFQGEGEKDSTKLCFS